MNIIGPDELVFGVEDIAPAATYLTDFGLTSAAAQAGAREPGGRFQALDGTGILIAHADDPALPPRLGTASMLRKIVYGVADRETLQAIASELGQDREVRRLADGAIETVDDMGFALRFQITVREKLTLAGESINAPGARPQRAPNRLGVDEDAVIKPRTLSHFALFVPDAAKAEAFYVGRLGFRCTDRMLGAGPFLRPGGTLEHHTLFLINTPPHMKGCEHVAFHLGGPSEVMLAGMRFVGKGYQSFWGPGRHTMGSNWFWYFNSPLGCRLEYDADMDLHDERWKPRELPAHADSAQAYLLQVREKWAPMGPRPKDAGPHA